MTAGAAHYGRALFELAAAEGCDGELLEQMGQLAGLFAENPGYARLLDAPTLRREERCALVDQALRGRVHPYLLNTLKLMAERALTAGFGGAQAEYRRAYQKAHGILEMKAVTAVPMDGAMQERLRERLAQLTGKQIQLSCSVDPALLGGIRLESEGRQLDGSVRGRLEALRRSLLQKN